MDEFDELQAHLVDVWPALTLRTTAPQLRTVIMLHSVPFDIVPRHLSPVFPAYEERFLAVVLSLLRAPGSRVIYLTSQPISPRVVDYWFGLVPGVDAQEARSRLYLISPCDGSPRSLTDKLLDRPRLLDRIRRLVIDPRLAVVIPFVCREAEARFALELGVPVYGSNPRLWELGGKSRSRRVFRDACVPIAEGVEDVRSRDDLVAALFELRQRVPGVRRVMVKHDQGVSGYGNAVIDLTGVGPGAGELAAAVERLEVEDNETTTEEFLGRYSLDFVVVRDDGGPWRAFAIEINLRCGGTTHPFMALQTLTDGEFDSGTGVFTDPRGRPKFYAASDHLEDPSYARLTPDDLFDILSERRIGWDDRTMTGVAVHMASALAVSGRAGATAIAGTPGHADALLEAVRHALDVEAARG